MVPQNGLDRQTREVTFGVPTDAIPVTVCTDGSLDHEQHVGGFGWVSDNGRFRTGLIVDANSVLTTELAAILDAVQRSKTDELLVLTDSRDALSLIRQVIDGHPVRDNREAGLARDIVEAAGTKHVVFRWVKGHARFNMNVAANALARGEVRARLSAATDEEHALTRMEVHRMGSRFAHMVRDGRSI